MFELKERINGGVAIIPQIFSLKLDHVVNLKPGIKTKNLHEFKQLFLDNFKKREDENDSAKSLKELERIYTTSLPGIWTDVYIKIDPYPPPFEPQYAHLQFKKVPSVIELLYTHNYIWKNYYIKDNPFDTKFYYSLFEMEANETILVFRPKFVAY